mmetsp:Transcript_3960/g.10946  ORF Transcript_3960/g.10946 Transcript_3960/m.10946 type:complete len:330 (+) Transcript_3960:1455-2444(+)
MLGGRIEQPLLVVVCGVARPHVRLLATCIEAKLVVKRELLIGLARESRRHARLSCRRHVLLLWLWRCLWLRRCHDLLGRFLDLLDPLTGGGGLRCGWCCRGTRNLGLSRPESKRPHLDFVAVAAGQHAHLALGGVRLQAVAHAVPDLPLGCLVLPVLGISAFQAVPRVHKLPASVHAKAPLRLWSRKAVLRAQEDPLLPLVALIARLRLDKGSPVVAAPLEAFICREGNDVAALAPHFGCHDVGGGIAGACSAMQGGHRKQRGYGRCCKQRSSGRGKCPPAPCHPGGRCCSVLQATVLLAERQERAISSLHQWRTGRHHEASCTPNHAL